MAPETQWDLATVFDRKASKDSASAYTVIVLNQPIRNVDVFLSICSRATSIIAADGGANRIKDLYLNEARLSKCMPYAIVGDLDSLRDDVRSYFIDKGVKVEEDSDQYSTDFRKCLKYSQKLQEQLAQHPSGKVVSEALDVIAFGGLGGRADQAFAQVHQLYTASLDKTQVKGRLYLVTSESIMFVLDKGRNRFVNMQSSNLFGENVGIIPIGQPAKITTTGLEWDVQDWHTDFESQVSTSNHIRSDMVSIETNTRILFTVELGIKPHP